MKIILDTNVIVSALISKGFPSKIIDQVLFQKSAEICLSDSIFEEYLAVLKREKFAKFPQFVQNSAIVLTQLSKSSVFYFPKEKVDLLKDCSDNKFLELAVAANADYLITGNTLDFTIQKFKNTQVVNPKTFWEILERK